MKALRVKTNRSTRAARARLSLFKTILPIRISDYNDNNNNPSDLMVCVRRSTSHDLRAVTYMSWRKMDGIVWNVRDISY